MVEGNLIEVTKRNFNELKILNIENLIGCPMIKFLINVIIKKLCDPRTFFISITIFSEFFLHNYFSMQDSRYALHKESSRLKEILIL